MAQGYLQVDVVSDTNNFPVTDASISISKTETPEEILEEVRTDSSGQTENVALEAPPAELSLAPSGERPYAEYTIRITAPGYDPFSVVVLGKFRRFLLVIFLSLFLHLDFSFIYSKFSMPFWGFF
ncbi:carboxypeptidase-like regulatory domain-containing protein, partial [Alitiscatomonas aceti]